MESDKAKMLLTGTMMRMKTAIKAKTMIFKDGKAIKPICCSSGCPDDEDKKMAKTMIIKDGKMDKAKKMLFTGGPIADFISTERAHQNDQYQHIQ